MAYEQWVVPNTNATDDTGMCLRFVQHVFQDKNPIYYGSAWEAWQNAVQKSFERNIPTDVAVVLWFSHFGTYGSPPRYANWGHTVASIPGRGLLSSPTWGHGQQWFSTIEEVERAFNCRFVGWSLDVGGLTVAWPKGVPYPGVTVPTIVTPPTPVPPAPKPIPLEEIMANPTYIRDKALGTKGSVYALNPVTGKKRRLPSPEWSALRAAESEGGEKLAVGLVSAADLEDIPNA